MDYEPLPIISNDFTKIVIPLIDSAEESIDIVVFDWRFYNRPIENPVTLFNDSINMAVSRGVNVRCVVQNPRVVDRLKQMGCNVRLLHSKRVLHTKMLIIDKTRVVLGSHNYTQHAFTCNHEASIYVVLKDTQNALVQYFDNLFGL